MKSIIRKWHLEGLAVISRGRKAPPRRFRKIFKPPWHIYKSIFSDCTVGFIQIPVWGILGSLWFFEGYRVCNTGCPQIPNRFRMFLLIKIGRIAENSVRILILYFDGIRFFPYCYSFIDIWIDCFLLSIVNFIPTATLWWTTATRSTLTV